MLSKENQKENIGKLVKLKNVSWIEDYRQQIGIIFDIYSLTGGSLLYEIFVFKYGKKVIANSFEFIFLSKGVKNDK